MLTNSLPEKGPHARRDRRVPEQRTTRRGNSSNRFGRLTQIAVLCLVSVSWLNVALGTPPPQTLSKNGGVQVPESAITEVTPDKDWQFRFDLFQMLLEQNELRPIKSFDAAFESPRKSVIVLMGNNSLLRNAVKFRKYLLGGGALLIASDRGGFFPGMFQMEPGPVVATDASVAYQNYVDCLRITDLNPDHRLCEGVSELVTNRTGWLSQVAMESAWDIVARLPEEVGSGRFERLVQAQGPLVAVMKPSTAEQAFIVAADHSLFTNGMMWHGDNAVFAINVAKMLCGEERTQLLFIIDERAQDSYLLGPLSQQLSLPEVDASPELTPAQMLEVANALIGNLEDENVFNELLSNRPRVGVRPQIYWRSLLFLLVAVLAVIGLSKLLGRSVGYRGPLLSMKPRVSSRHAASARLTTQLRTPESRTEAAVLLCQRFCQEMTRAREPDVWIQSFESKLKGLPVDAETTELRSKLAKVMAWATRSKLKPISEEQLLGLSRDLVTLRETLA